MNLRRLALDITITTGISGLAASAASAATVVLDLGQSSETFTLYGQGALSPGIGSYFVGQGAGTSDGSTSTFTLSGAITGGPAPYSTTTYQFITTYDGTDTSHASPHAPFAPANPSDPEEFFYDSLDPSTDMTLFLDTPGKD